MFSLFTDSSANLTDELIEQYSVSIISLNYTLDGKEYKSYVKGVKHNGKAFFERLRQKAEAATSLANTSLFIDTFLPELKKGKDIIYIGLSSGVSGTLKAAEIAAEDLRTEYPERNIIIIDSLTGGMAQGLLVCKAGKCRNNGMSAEETAKIIEKIKFKANIYFTVDDMFHLKRGGRVSGTTAVVGTVLNIKPIMAPDQNGKITLREKIRGRKNAIERMAQLFLSRSAIGKHGIVGINHGDCAEDAEFLAELIRKSGRVKNVIVNFLDPVLGIHAGPGALTIAFWGNER